METIKKITHEDKDKRRDEIISLITREYFIQKNGELLADVQNIVIPAKSGHARITFTAHYDLYPNSKGYNDNSSGVSVLLKLQDYLEDDMSIVFTDYEEWGGKGMNYFCQEFSTDYVFNLDVVGFGKNLFVDFNGNRFPMLPENYVQYDDVPFNDSHIATEHGIPAILLLTGNDKKTLISDIFDHQHGGKFDNDITRLEQSTLDNVLEFVKEFIRMHKNEK